MTVRPDFGRGLLQPKSALFSDSCGLGCRPGRRLATAQMQGLGEGSVHRPGRVGELDRPAALDPAVALERAAQLFDLELLDAEACVKRPAPGLLEFYRRGLVPHDEARPEAARQ